MATAHYSIQNFDAANQAFLQRLETIGFATKPLTKATVANTSIAKTQTTPDIYLFSSQAHHSQQERENIQQLLKQQHSCYIVSFYNPSTSEDPDLEETRSLFPKTTPVIHPPFNAPKLIEQLGLNKEEHSKNLCRVMLVDDSRAVLTVMELYIQELGYEYWATQSALEAREKLKTDNFDILVTDYLMDEMSGIQLIHDAKKITPYIHTVLITAFGSKATLLEAIHEHIHDFIEKPVEQLQLTHVLQQAEHAVALRKSHSRLLAELTEKNTSLAESKETLNAALESLEEKVKERTRKLNHAKDEAEFANRSKSEFLANMSHELRTPMHAIISFNSLIQDCLEENLDLEERKSKVNLFCSRIDSSSTRLLTLINNLLDIAKIESGKESFNIENIDLLPSIESIIDETHTLAQEKNLSIKITNKADKTHCDIDNEKISQVIYNLISNAIKFSHSNTTIVINIENSTLDIERRKAEENIVDSIEVSVIDQGIGIPAGEENSIFEEFIQSSKTKTGAGGTGLGLTISKKIILLHRGTISAKNNKDNGANFTFNIPILNQS